MKKLKWCNRTLITSPYCFSLCLSEEAFNKELKRLNVPLKGRASWILNSHSNATIHFFSDTTENKRCAIVCLKRRKGLKIEEIHGLLVHEATHLWQTICEDIGESSPSAEFEAYCIQAISQELMLAYKELK